MNLLDLLNTSILRGRDALTPEQRREVERFERLTVAEQEAEIRAMRDAFRAPAQSAA